MPFPAATPHVDDTIMLWSAIQTNLDGYRTYVNSVDVTDFASESIRREHLARPVVEGFPSRSIQSSFQGVWWRTWGMEEPAAIARTEFSSRRNRLTWFPARLSAGEKWTFPVGATLYLPVQSWVEAHVGTEVAVVHDAAVECPDGAARANSVVGGYLTCRLRHRDTASEFTFGRHDLYPQSLSGGSGGTLGAVKLGFAQELAAGTWDILLQYIKASGAGSIYQFDLGRVSMKLEAH